MRFKPKYFYIALAILFSEVTIVIVFSRMGFIRGSLGDALVVMLLYYLVLSFHCMRPILLATTVFLFACAIEIGQYFQLIQRLGLEQQSLARILLGNTFSGTDLVMYFMGSLAALTLDQLISGKPLLRRQKRRAM